jgi:hypothetical protein
LGFALRTTLGASLGFLWSPGLLAQVPLPAAPARPDNPPAAPASPPAGEPAMPPPPTPPPPTAPPPPKAASAPPPLDPPPANVEPPSRPAFLHTREEMEHIKGELPARDRPAPSQPVQTPTVAKESPVDFVRRSSPWVDFSLTSFWMDDRVGNFLNFGVQVGGYLFNRLRVSGRLVAPLEEVSDGYYSYNDYYLGGSSGSSYNSIDSRKVSVLYGASAGLMVTNSRAFVFGPGVTLLRTDVEAYGTAIYLTLPFEWTTQRNLRIGFELGLGRAVGGKVRKVCRNSSTTPPTACGIQPIDRPDGTALLAQFYMGWSLGSL